MSQNGQTNTNNDFLSDKSDGEMSAYKKDALSVVTFKTVYSKKDICHEGGVKFKPEMAHQIFGESESIFGYRSVSIYLYFLHNSCKFLADVKTSGKLDNDTLEADDVVEKLKTWLPNDHFLDQKKFCEEVEKEEHDKLVGKVLDVFEDKEERFFEGKEISVKYKITLGDIKDQQLQTLHSHFETFIVWYIDGANSIDISDERWMLFYVYEEFEHPEKNTTYRSPIGYCSVYKFFAYPNQSRARISQFFILPSHQKRGIGSKLYRAVTKTLRDMDEILDITVEEPTETFQKLRDTNDAFVIHKELQNSKMDYFSIGSKEIFDIAKKLKICKRQAQRVYDILGGVYSKEKGVIQYMKFKNKVQERISSQMERENRVGKRFCDLRRVGIIPEPVDKTVQIEAETKRYIEDIEVSIKRLRDTLKS